jgi:hypothetical protein
MGRASARRTTIALTALGMAVVAAAPAAAAPASNVATLVATVIRSGGEVGPVIPNDDNTPGVQSAPNTLLPAGSPVHPAAAAPPKATGTPVTYRVYATREGLVGHTTANGHKIVPNDRFVSLPDWHSLSAKGKNSYSVRVCAASTKRCVYDPVWDVGPWNTSDGYWNIKRTSWTKLPRGLPESQAAYQNGYNGGKDQFGRKVLNPAGIDLADGTIGSAGLGLGGSGWVTVTYLWTGGGARGHQRRLAQRAQRPGHRSQGRGLGRPARQVAHRVLDQRPVDQGLDDHVDVVRGGIRELRLGRLRHGEANDQDHELLNRVRRAGRSGASVYPPSARPAPRSNVFRAPYVPVIAYDQPHAAKYSGQNSGPRRAY